MRTFWYNLSQERNHYHRSYQWFEKFEKRSLHHRSLFKNFFKKNMYLSRYHERKNWYYRKTTDKNFKAIFNLNSSVSIKIYLDNWWHDYFKSIGKETFFAIKKRIVDIKDSWGTERKKILFAVLEDLCIGNHIALFLYRMK